MRQKVALTEQTGYHSYAANGRPIPRRATAPAADTTYSVEYDELDTTDESEYELPRMPNSARRYLPEGPYTQRGVTYNVKYAPAPARQKRPAQQQKRTAQPQRRPVTDDLPRQKGGIHWFVFVGIGMIGMLALWVLGSGALTWWQMSQDDIHYGRPRTYQCDAVVGHNDSKQNPSHFIAINLNRHIEVIEFPGGDGAKARIFLVVTLFGDNQDLTPVTLSFKDVTGNGKPDMLIHVDGQTIVYINENGTFRPSLPTDTIHM